MNKPLPMNVTQVIECTDLVKNFDEGPAQVQVLKNIHFSVKPGERIAIVGASGSGKSTFLHLLGGLDLPTAGQVMIAGHVMSQLSDRERSLLRNQCLGFVYQFHHLLAEFTVLENVCIPLLIRGMSPQLAEDKAMHLLEKVDLKKRYLHKISELSGGERQRTAIVRALITEPLCVLADEPTGNLDQHTAERVYETMLELNTLSGTSFVIVTHDIKLASRMDSIFTMSDGHLVRCVDPH